MDQAPAIPRFSRALARTPEAQLLALPDLADEAWVTRLAKNPAPRAGRGGQVPGSRPPTDLAVIDAVARRDGGEVFKGLHGTAVAVHNLHPETGAVPPASDHRALCNWLRTRSAVWGSSATLSASVTESVEKAYHLLLDMVRHRGPHYVCPACEGDLVLQGTENLRCTDCGREESSNLERRYRRRPAMREREVAEEFGIRVERIRVWRTRRRIAPVYLRPDGPWYLPWDVLLLVHPDIAQALKQREA